MSTGTGVNVSKANVYVVLLNPPQIAVSKANAYAVLSNSPGANVSKANAYAVLATSNFTPPIWGAFTFANGVLGVTYSQSWDMPTSAQTVTYSVLSGSLPTGLSLSALSGNQAMISGTPTATGTFSFTLRAVNSYGTADQPFTIAITTAPGGGFSYGFVC